MTGRQYDAMRWARAAGPVWGLLALGLALRLAGLPFNGMHDLDEIIFKWGCSVRELGIARAFVANYGLFSYALYGWAVAWAEPVARFWWLPYKLIEIACEAGVLAALYALMPADRRRWAMWLYWLNPWFILHGGWQGFWEGPHTLLALAAILCLQRVGRESVAWGAAGVCLMAAGMFKPQGLVYFVAPLGLYLGVQVLRCRWRPLAWYGLGAVSVLALAGGYLAINGGEFIQLVSNYGTAATVMPNLCNGCINIWRPVTLILYVALGPDQFRVMLGAGGWLNMALTLVSFVVAFALIGWLVWRVSREAPRYLVALSILAFASLVVPQLGARAHVNHTYAGLILLIPFLAAGRRWWAPWGGMVAIHFYCHVAMYHLGRAAVLPEQYLDYAPAQALLGRVQAAVAAQPFPWLLQLQARANQLLNWPVEPMLSQLSVIQFLLVLWIVYGMLSHPAVWKLPLPNSGQPAMGEVLRD